MLLQLIVLSLFNTILALEKPYYDVDDLEEVGRHFENFIQDHNRTYTDEEKIIRFKVFHDNLRDINKWNDEYELTTFDINHFADKTKEEKELHFGFKLSDGVTGRCQQIPDPPTKPAPTAWDWRQKNIVTPAKDQTAKCGSCWAFSTTGMLESRYLQLKNKRLSLSEQMLVDCDKASHGCTAGGLMTNALSYIIDAGGIMSDQEYPYMATDGQCRFNKSKVVATVASCRGYVISSEDKLKELLYQEGPLSIGLHASIEWLSYKGGVYQVCPTGQVNHAVLLVGYGTEKGQDFWVIKDSSGPKFGEQGFIRVLRGKGCWGLIAKDYNAVVSVTI